ncbi:MAG: hypothetical protein AAF492_02310, partial [Verrucomicrobiota bacterium]
LVIPGSLGILFWFKGCYHWVLAKGLPRSTMWIGLTGFPVALIVLRYMKDYARRPPPVGDPLRTCPECETSYRLSEYDPEAPRIFCSSCQCELPKSP